MKNIFFVLLLLVPVIQSRAQEDLKDAIMSFTDSTQTLIENGRKLIVKHIIDHKYNEANKVLNYLKKEAGNNYVVLYTNEEILVSLAIRNFQLFLYDARNISNLLEGKKKFPKYDDISYDLHANIQEQMSSITVDLDLSELSEPDKQLISLYLDYYNSIGKLTLKKKLTNYNKQYPNNEYQDFLKQIKSSTYTGRFNFGLGYLNESLSGEITNTIDPNISGMSMEMDFVSNRTYATLYFGGNINSMYSKTDLPILDTEWNYLVGNEVATMHYGLKLGYIAFMNRWMKTYPYVNIGGFSVTAQADDIDEDEKNELMGCFMPGIGIASEMNLLNWGSKSVYGTFGYLYLKPNLDISFLTTKKEQFKGQSISFSVTLGFAFGNF